MPRFSGRQTQFYIDIVYGIAFSLGFGYLLFFGMDPGIAAFEGGLVLGYFLRVVENMTVYEQVLEEQVAEEAEAVVAEEVAERVPAEAEDQVEEEVEAQIPGEVETQVQEEVQAQVSGEVEEQVQEEVEEQVLEEVEAELVDRVNEIDEELAAELRERLEGEPQSS